MISAINLWAKLRRDRDGYIVGWHSLVHHSADVAAVMLALLAQPTIAARLAYLAKWSHLDSVTIDRLGALAFLHDIGKANRGFRARVDPRAPLVGHIDQVAWLFISHKAESHLNRLRDVLGLDRLDTWFSSGEDLLAPVFAHHGRPWTYAAASTMAPLWRRADDCDPIGDLSAMRDALDQWFPNAFEPGPTLPGQPGFAHAFAGLLMLADWLGSDDSPEFFPFADCVGSDRMVFAKTRAAQAVQVVGLQSMSSDDRRQVAAIDFTRAFGVSPARPMQSAAAAPQAPCVVLEAETGSGKTEAALWRFKHLFEQGAVDGLYFALPTRVASTAMFERVKLFRNRVFGSAPPAVVLAVPGQVAMDDVEGRRLPDFGFEWDDAADNGVSKARWAAEHPKRFLAATIVVGTIDQALLGAIRVKHAHMRGATLLRHLLVVDEVHASDRYMETLLSTLLANHCGAGGHALLLSATLGAAARSRLLQTPCPSSAAAEAVPYPALSWACDGIEHRHERASDAPCEAKHVKVETRPSINQPDAVAKLALDAATLGAKVLVIRNTVGAAVMTARALEMIAGEASDVLFRASGIATVHHGRFASGDRRLLDKAVEEGLGRGRIGPGQVVIGTQTLEVSLDLDADLLITDLCPADVLLQRIGRLHRHVEADRPAGFKAARVVVLVPEARGLLPFTGRFGGRHGLGRVYDDLRVIEATWRMIEAMPSWSIPADNRHLVEQTTHPEHLGRIGTELAAADAAAWSRHMNDKDGRTAAELNLADANRLDWSVPFDNFTIDLDERAMTRLGAADRQVDLGTVPGPFGRPIGSLRVPFFLLDGVVEGDEVCLLPATSDMVRFRLGTGTFRYDRFGLKRERV